MFLLRKLGRAGVFPALGILFSLNVHAQSCPEGFIKKTNDKCGWVTLEAIVTNGVAIKDYAWAGPTSSRDSLVNVHGSKLKIRYKTESTDPVTKYPISVTFTSQDGCDTTVTDTITLNSNVYITLGPDTSVSIYKYFKIHARTYFGRPDYLYSWYVYNAKTQTYDLKVDRVKNQDSYYITANTNKTVVISVLDGNGCDNSDTLRINTSGPSESIGEKTAEAQIHIYPNPASETVTIEMGDLKVASMSLYNSLGQEIYYNLKPGSRMQLRVAGYKPGVYFVRVSTAGGVVVKKLVIE